MNRNESKAWLWNANIQYQSAYQLQMISWQQNQIVHTILKLQAKIWLYSANIDLVNSRGASERVSDDLETLFFIFIWRKIISL